MVIPKRRLSIASRVRWLDQHTVPLEDKALLYVLYQQWYLADELFVVETLW
jgi:hypothetical protein